MTKNTQRLALSLLLAGGIGACSSDQQHAESTRPASEYAGAESGNYGSDQTAIMDAPDTVPTTPDQNLPGEPGSISPSTRSRDSEIASDVEGVLPGDAPPPPVVPIDETTPAQGTRGAQGEQARTTQPGPQGQNAQRDTSGQGPQQGAQAGQGAQGAQQGAAATNTAQNAGQGVTPSDQGTSPRDLQITQRIREAVMENDQLSFTAKNVKIITKDGKVYLRGPVRSQNERRAIEKTAVSVAGREQVTNELEIQ